MARQILPLSTTWALAALLIVGLATPAPAFTHDDLVHDLCHYGASTMLTMAVRLSGRRQPSWTQTAIELGLVVSVNVGYEVATRKTFPVALERTAAASLGALQFRYVVLEWQ